MAFVLHGESNADGSIFYIPAGFENYLENIHTAANVPALFADDFFEDLPIQVHVPNPHPQAPAPHLAPGTPPQGPPLPANNMGATVPNNDDDDDDDQSFSSGDDQSFSSDDDAPCGDYGGHVSRDECTITDTAMSGSNVQTAGVAPSTSLAAQTILSEVHNIQTTTANVQTTQNATENYRTLINIQAAFQANLPNRVDNIHSAPAFVEDDIYSGGFDILSVHSNDSDESEARFLQRPNNQDIIPEENGHGTGGGEEPTPSSKDTVTLRVNNDRPNFSFDQLRDSPIASMLPEFLARMESANQELEAERVAGTLANRRIEVDENQNASESGQYIEMNLGLGVLEERTDDTSSSSDNESSSSVADEGVMSRLLGGKRKRDTEDEEAPEIKKPKIEEL